MQLQYLITILLSCSLFIVFGAQDEESVGRLSFLVEESFDNGESWVERGTLSFKNKEAHLLSSQHAIR